MAYAGQIIRNPVSGEQIEFLRTAADTDGELLELNLSVAPDGKVPGIHVHPHQEERFEVLEGKMRFRMGLKTIEAGPGDVVTVPAGKAHKFANAGDEVAVARVQVTPALEMERLLETAVELAEEGRVMRSGMPKPLDLALFVGEFSRRGTRSGLAGLAAARDARSAGVDRQAARPRQALPAAPRRNGLGAQQARPRLALVQPQRVRSSRARSASGGRRLPRPVLTRSWSPGRSRGPGSRSRCRCRRRARRLRRRPSSESSPSNPLRSSSPEPPSSRSPGPVWLSPSRRSSPAPPSSRSVPVSRR